MVYGIVNLINFAHGEVLMVGALTSWSVTVWLGPLGLPGWLLLLIALLLVETLSGIYVYNDVADEGPLSEIVPAPVANAISSLHALGWDLLLAAVVLHVCAIAVYAIAKGHHLVGPMISGRKRLPSTVRAPSRAPLWLAALLLGCAALVVAALATWL